MTIKYVKKKNTEKVHVFTIILGLHHTGDTFVGQMIFVKKASLKYVEKALVFSILACFQKTKQKHI